MSGAAKRKLIGDSRSRIRGCKICRPKGLRMGRKHLDQVDEAAKEEKKARGGKKMKTKSKRSVNAVKLRNRGRNC